MQTLKLKAWLNASTVLNYKAFARAINYDEGNFNNWLKGKRPLPEDRVKQLASLAMLYGFNPDQADSLEAKFTEAADLLTPEIHNEAVLLISALR